MYVEPFCGMMGVLLTGSANIEIANDLDGHIITWWKALRDQPDEFARRLKCTPHSEQLYDEATEYLDKGNGDGSLEHAVHVHVKLAYGIVQSMNRTGFADGLRRNSSGVSRGRPFRDSEHVSALSDRIKNVTLLNRDAVDIVKKVRDNEHCMIYCDPPYQGHVGEVYAKGFDLDVFTEAVTGAKAKIAISGYPGDFDHLEGFQRHEFQSISWMAVRNKQDDRTRTECLWINFDAANVRQPNLFDD